MRKPALQTISLLLGLLLFVAPGSGGAEGYVWCIGEDGHAALEYSLGDVCGAGPQKQDCPAGIDPGLSLQDDHCGPCLDIPPSLDAASGRLRDHQVLGLQLPPPALLRQMVAPSFLRVATAGLYPQPPPRISQTILSHRTVVLLN